jgi:hypothetical protein
MKKQRFELTHDIVAETIWNRMPEQDRQLREIKRSIAQRLEDYEKGKGSLLGKAELSGWEVYLPLLELSKAEEDYLKASRRLEKNRQIAKRAIFATILVIAIIAIGASVFAIRQLNEAQANLRAYKNEELQRFLRDAEAYIRSGDLSYARFVIDSAQRIRDLYFPDSLAVLNSLDRSLTNTVGCAPCNYSELIEQGRLFADSIKDYPSALHKFESARRCNPRMNREIDSLVQSVVMEIKKQRDNEIELAVLKKNRNSQLERWIANSQIAFIEKRFSDALWACDYAMALAITDIEKKDIQQKMAKIKKAQIDFEFNRNLEIGLSLLKADEFIAALPYLEDANSIFPNDSTANRAIATCIAKSNGQ